MRLNRIGAAFAGLGVASALVLTGCTDAGGDNNAAGETAVITANGSEPQNPLIPTNTNEVGGGKILDNIFAGLIYYAADGSPVNDVAESIETEDNQNYTITIRDGLTFTNDEPVTAQSFVDAWNYGAYGPNAQLSSYFFESIEGFADVQNTMDDPTGAVNEDGTPVQVADPLTETMSGLEVVDETTFTVRLVSPQSDFPLRLGYSAFYPLPESAFEDMDAFGENPSGNGPYMFDGEDAWQHNVRVDLVPNPDYDGPREPANDGLSIVFYATQEAAYSDIQGGNLDILDAVPDSAFATFEDEFGDRAVNQPAAIFQSFTIPSRLDHFGGEEGVLRRQAISMAINREEITDVIFEGTRTPATDFTSPVIDGYSDSLEGAEVLEYNPEEAVALWEEANAISEWEGQFGIAYNADGGHAGWVDAVSNSIKNTLGIDAAGIAYPTFAESRTLITNRTIDTAFRTGWQADYPALANFLGPIYATGAGSNDGDYSSEEFDSLLNEGLTATDPEAANELFQQAQEVLLEDLPAIPLWYSNATGVYSEDLENVEFGWNSVPIYHEITKE